MMNDGASTGGPGSSAVGTGAEQVLSAHAGDDPSRDLPTWATRHLTIAAILDAQEQENATRPDFTPAISREMIERAANQLFGIYDCRSSDFAAVYAWTGLWQCLGLDWQKSSLVFFPAQAIEARSGETAGLDPKDESAVLAEDASSPSHPGTHNEG